MSIQVLNENRLFHLSTRRSSYVLGVNEVGRLEQFHYGARIADAGMVSARVFRVSPASFSPYHMDENGLGTPDTLPVEISGANAGDLRLTALDVTDAGGAEWGDPRFVSYEICKDKRVLSGLPQCFAGKAPEGMEQLRLTLKDEFTGLEVLLLYTVFEECDVIARSMVVTNGSTGTMTVKRALSMQLDLRGVEDYDWVNSQGWYSCERWMERHPLHQGLQSTGSMRGATSHNHTPAMALAEPGANEHMGQVYGFMLGYSGNHFEGVELEQFGLARVLLGIHPELFTWKLEPGESFETPEAYVTVSQAGLGQMSRNFHDFIRGHVIRSPWNGKQRPILVNNWEATYFDFDARKILDIAQEAAKLNIEMLVLDDGWFGHRDNDKSSLGDWFEHRSKVGDMADLAAGIHALGMKFGLWYEPEMISEESELYKAHPEWVLCVPNRPRCYGRTQLILDFSRPEVVDHLFEVMSAMIRKAKIDYIKWDMNRNMTDVFSAVLPDDRQGEVSHRYILGVYRLHEMLIQAFPNLLIEGCSGGGGRYDAGMMYYVPQIWCSDNTDAMERLRIQSGTSLFYPVASMGAHINALHRQWRFIPFKTRGDVAMAGTFGYELDLTKMTAEEKKTAITLNAAYHRYHDTISEGDYYRLTDVFEDTPVAAWCAVSKDKSQAVLTVVRRECRGGIPTQPKFRIPGLEAGATYRLYLDGEKTEQVYPADVLENYGLWTLELEWADCASRVYLLEKEA